MTINLMVSYTFECMRISSNVISIRLISFSISHVTHSENLIMNNLEQEKKFLVFKKAANKPDILLVVIIHELANLH